MLHQALELHYKGDWVPTPDSSCCSCKLKLLIFILVYILAWQCNYPDNSTYTAVCTTIDFVLFLLFFFVSIFYVCFPSLVLFLQKALELHLVVIERHILEPRHWCHQNRRRSSHGFWCSSAPTQLYGTKATHTLHCCNLEYFIFVCFSLFVFHFPFAIFSFCLFLYFYFFPCFV